MSRNKLHSLLVAATLCVAGCGGDNGSQQQSAGNATTLASIFSSTDGASTAVASRSSAMAKAGGASADNDVKNPATTPEQASAFLGRATFGPTEADINNVVAQGPSAWLDAQFDVQNVTSFRGYMDHFSTLLEPGRILNQDHFFAAFWKNAIMAVDPVRQRMQYALSQIFVVSFQDGAVAAYPRGVACYYDVLGKHAFGNFRDLLEAVATSPMMGLYLSHMQNNPETDTTTPDENFAREIMQLMSIGLHQLNQDGTPKLSNGEFIPTYTRDDVVGLAKVFTGWSWGGGEQTENRYLGMVAYSSRLRDCLPMQNYAAHHSTSEKRFLGRVVPAGGTGEADLKIALDTLFNHPNVGPFIGRQLIQRLVTSNPSPAYIARVAAAFANNGEGVRGDMKAVWRAILLDPEAIKPVNSNTAGMLREPVLRLANWMRAFTARSESGLYKIWTLEDPLNGIGQAPMRSPSVFNFFRPNYTPPRTSIAHAGMVAPEMQLTSETSVIGWLNFMEIAVNNGVGMNFDIRPHYDAEFALAETPEKLVDRVNLLLLHGTMSQALYSQILATVKSLAIPDGSNIPRLRQARANRAYIAVYMTMASPEYLVQK